MKYAFILVPAIIIATLVFKFLFTPSRGRVVNLAKDDFQVQILKFESQNPGGKSVIIVPPTGGTNFLDRSYGATLSENGFDVYIVENWTGSSEYSLELEIHHRFYSRSQRALDVVLQHIKSPFIGILGTSVGGIHTALAMNRYESLDAAFVIAGGASIPEIIANSDQEVLVEAKKKRFAQFGFKTQQEYIEALKKVLSSFTMHPLRVESKKHLGMVIANEDTSVPVENQWALRELWQPQVVYEMPDSHILAILKTWFFHRSDVVAFFKDASR